MTKGGNNMDSENNYLTTYDLHGISIALSIAIDHCDNTAMTSRLKSLEEKVEAMITET
jgi:hypothetical protein